MLKILSTWDLYILFGSSQCLPKAVKWLKNFGKYLQGQRNMSISLFLLVWEYKSCSSVSQKDKENRTETWTQVIKALR